MKTVLAFDFGASSGRAIKACYDGTKITYNEIHRFENKPIIENGQVHHDVDMIFGEIKKALGKAGDIDSLAFDTWGVDYALLDGDDNIICPPFHYRDERTADAIERLKGKMDYDDLYAKSGNQIMNINTLFQLCSDENLNKAKSILFMPDLFSFLLSGNKVCEHTIASTSQMLEPNSKSWNQDILDAYGISRNIFPPLVPSCTVNGEYNGIKVISVAGHDTQCAVAAMPCTDDNSAFLSCGTWSLIGCELDSPILTKESNALELSNELGANGKINYLKNISGLWLIQETKRHLKSRGNSYSYNDLEQLARASQPFKCLIDPDSPILSTHGNLPDKIKSFCESTNQPAPQTVGELVRCIYESLALKYRYALEQISSCTGKEFTCLNLLGGGTKDGFLCELTANSINIPVKVGPIEATALGNIVLQLVALGELKDVNQGRQIILSGEEIKEYEPHHSTEWDKAYEIFKTKIVNK
ncbi:MAG: rhamnulokinase family protein [Eubacterium sp.]